VQGVMFHKNSSNGSRETPKILPSSHKVLLIIHLPQPNCITVADVWKVQVQSSWKIPSMEAQVTFEEVLSSQSKMLLIID
jgi:hypothetical protein